MVGLAWIVLSLFGGLPFLLCGMFDKPVDAFFEAVSGFTTTGATVLTDFEGQGHGVMFWRSFTHWIGGMGVLVLTLALLPKVSGHTSHLMRAESPGPTLSKIVPKLGDTAKILYMIYIGLTLLEFVALLLCGMNAYDAAIHAFGTAGTGGFSNYGASVGAFDSAAVDVVITVFMIIFGVNFSLYYALLIRNWRGAFHSEELHWYLGMVAVSILLMTLFILPCYDGFWTALRYAGFQVASIVSTTGFATADFIKWPVQARMLILALMFVGSCAGSTAGGMKVVRVALLSKNIKRQVLHTFQPRRVQVIRFEDHAVSNDQLRQISVFTGCYVMLVLLGGFLISLEGLYDVETNFTAALTCMSNVGPGFGAVGPVENFAGYGPFAKIVLSLLMLAGRLEIFPMLVMFHPDAWRRI